jgi:hypothetical protein
MLKFVRSGRKETTYSAGLHPVIKAGLRADHGEHTVFVPFRLESINTQHNIGVLVSGNGYSHGIVVTDPTKGGKKFKITSNVEKYNIYIDGQKYDGRELDFGQIYTLSFSAELGTLVHLGASKLVTADFYQGIKVFSERKIEGESIVAEHTKWTTKYGEEKTKTLAAIEAAKLVPVQPKPATPVEPTPAPAQPPAATPANPAPATPAVPETPKNVNPNIPNNNILELGEGDRAKFGIYTFNLVLSDNETQTSQSDGKGELKISVVKSVPPVEGYIFYATDNDEDKGQPNYVAQTDKPVKKPAPETSSDTAANQPEVSEQPTVTQPQPVAPASPQPSGESGQTENPATTESGNNGAVTQPESPQGTPPTSEATQPGNSESGNTELKESEAAAATQPAPANSETESTAAVIPAPATEGSQSEQNTGEVAKPVESGSSEEVKPKPENNESPVVTPSETATPNAENTPKESEAQNGGANTAQPAAESEGNKPAGETEQPSGTAETNPPVTSGNTENSETEDEEETAKGQEAKGMYTFNLKNATEESVKSDGEGLTVRAVATSTPVVGYKLIVKEDK